MQKLRFILSRYPPDCRPAHVAALGNAGGMSGATLWRITAARGQFALRRWPPEHPTPERLAWIHAVLQCATDRGITFLPVPTASLDGRTSVNHKGQLWELAPWMPGRADYNESPSRAKLQAALAALATFHVATASFPLTKLQLQRVSVGAHAESTSHSDAPLATNPRFDPSPSVTRRLALLRDLTTPRIIELARSIDHSLWPDLAPLARHFLSLLPRAVPHTLAQLAPLVDVPLPLQPCLRDIWHDHVLFTGDEVTGLVDFGAMDFETPAADIARLLGSLARDDEQSWQTGLAAYQSVRPLSERELRAVAPFDTSGILLAGCNWIRWIYADGRQFEDQSQITKRFQQLVERCALIVP